jgi:hypothetical protein
MTKAQEQLATLLAAQKAARQERTKTAAMAALRPLWAQEQAERER